MAIKFLLFMAVIRARLVRRCSTDVPLLNFTEEIEAKMVFPLCFKKNSENQVILVFYYHRHA
jgi:hypothetical protein